MKVVSFHVESNDEPGHAGDVHAVISVDGKFIDVVNLIADIRRHDGSNAAQNLIDDHFVKEEARIAAQPKEPYVAPSFAKVVSEPAIVVTPVLPSDETAKRRGRPPKAVAAPVTEPVSMPLPFVTPPAKSEPPKVNKINNGEFAILSWKENDQWVAQIEIGQDPTISGMKAVGSTEIGAVALVSDHARKALSAKKIETVVGVPAIDVVPASVGLITFNDIPAPVPTNGDTHEPVDIPSGLLSVQTFRQVINYFLANGYAVRDTDKITAECLRLQAHVPAIARLTGDVGARVRRACEMIEMETSAAG